MDWLKKFMSGRYGVDQFSIALLISSIILSLFISLSTTLLNIPLLSLLIYIPLILCYFRIFSRNISKRQQENFKFLRYWHPVKSWGNKKIKRIKGMKTHKYYKCPECSKTLRVPRGKGNIRITCPQCKKSFSKRT